jgi:hypothetical protein
MRQFLCRLLERNSRHDPSAQRKHPRDRARVALSLEPLEARELLTVSVTPVFAVTNSWSSGYQADLRLDSHQAASIAPWRLEFDLTANISSIWNAKIVSHASNHYVIGGASWNSTLAGNGSVDFGFVAAATGVPAPINYLLNGEALGLATTPPPGPPSLSISDVTIAEGDSGTRTAVLTVSLSSAAASAVTVQYATTPGTAQSTSDYLSASGTLTFAPRVVTRILSLAVVGDTAVEPDENFFVDLTAANGATLAKSRSTVTITNDDAPPASGDFQFTVSSDWGTGFTGQIAMRNATASAVSNWQLEFDFAGSITSIWDAAITSHIGNHYVLANAGYNATIAPGATGAFGFNGARANTSVVPSNFVLRSGSGTSVAGHAPMAVDDLAYTQPGQAVAIDVLANDTDSDGDALSVSAVAAATHGTLAIQSNGTILYTPQAGYAGSDAFSYTLRDAQGGTATGHVTVAVTPVGVWPAHVFAPYVDMTLYPMYDLTAAASTQGLKYFTLAFVVADAAKKPAWGGYAEYELGTSFDAQMKNQISGVRALGGDVIVSFGGAAGQELALVITDVTALKNAYQSIVDAYGLTHIDFDVEGAAVADRVSIDRRNQAIAALQQAAATAGKSLDVSYTLPVLPSGLTADGLYVLQSALRFGVNVGNVNVMAMDYGDSAAPNPQGKMGDYAIAAANSLFAQLKTLYGASKTDAQLWNLVGVTPMIGLNDITSETFDQQEARELEAFAMQKGIGRIAMWSLNRDQQNAAGKINYVDNFSSSLAQSPYEFSQIFKPFSG